MNHTIRNSITALLVIAATGVPVSGHAQGPRAAASYSTIAMPVSGGVQARARTASYLIESAGGTAGSLIGMGVGLALLDDCESEDIACELSAAGGTLAIATAFSAAGTYLVGRAYDTEPSGLGAALGSAVGAVAGVGAWHLVREDLRLIRSEIGGLIVYSAVQGAVSALGSRIVAELRR